jgi:hypothetical protein
MYVRSASEQRQICAQATRDLVLLSMREQARAQPAIMTWRKKHLAWLPLRTAQGRLCSARTRSKMPVRKAA